MGAGEGDGQVDKTFVLGTMWVLVVVVALTLLFAFGMVFLVFSGPAAEPAPGETDAPNGTADPTATGTDAATPDARGSTVPVVTATRPHAVTGWAPGE